MQIVDPKCDFIGKLPLCECSLLFSVVTCSVCLCWPWLEYWLVWWFSVMWYYHYYLKWKRHCSLLKNVSPGISSHIQMLSVLLWDLLHVSSNLLLPFHWQECNPHYNTKTLLTAILSALAICRLKNSDCNGNAVSFQLTIIPQHALVPPPPFEHRPTNLTWRHNSLLPPCYPASHVFACVHVKLMRVCICVCLCRCGRAVRHSWG